MLNYFQKNSFFYYWSGTISPYYKMNSQRFLFYIFLLNQRKISQKAFENPKILKNPKNAWFQDFLSNQFDNKDNNFRKNLENHNYTEFTVNFHDFLSITRKWSSENHKKI